MNCLLNVFLFTATLLQGSDALLVGMPARPVAAAGSQRTGALQMGLFDGFAKAFANDDTLGDRADAGLLLPYTCAQLLMLLHGSFARLHARASSLIQCTLTLNGLVCALTLPPRSFQAEGEEVGHLEGSQR